jgi:hypothetical protein
MKANRHCLLKKIIVFLFYTFFSLYQAQKEERVDDTGGSWEFTSQNSCVTLKLLKRLQVSLLTRKEAN